MMDIEPDSKDQRGLSLVVDPDDAHSKSPEFARSLAVVIGINDYCHGIAPLRTAARDAEVLARILAEEHHYHVLHLLIHDVTLARLKTLFKDELCGEVSANDRVVVYFAGHGIALEGSDGPAGYLVPQDARPEDYSTFLPMHEFHDALMALDCRHMLIILDCCFAGAMRWSSTRALPILPPVIHQERYARFIRDRAWQVLTSAAYDQTALDVLKGSREEDNAGVTSEHSPFALALFEGLRGKGDVVPVEQKDGVITATELYLYLRDYVERRAEDIAGHLQTPGLWPLKKHEKGEYIFLSPNFSPDNLPPAPELNADNNPYRGLKAFEEEHAALFFGRTALVKDLAGTVIRQPLTVVLGASGTGKSSVVKAGLLPHLGGAVKADQEANEEPNAQGWLILPPLRPTEAPLRELEHLLHRYLPESSQARDFQTAPGALAATVSAWGARHPGQKLLLVIDQLEELITLCRDDGEREQFLALLESALDALPEQVRLILTLRSDFEPQFAHTALQAYWLDARFVIPPMNQTELREVIEGPASVRVLYFDPPELVDRLIEEVVQTPGALPLLSFTLSELYMKYIERQGDDRALSKADYDALGGVVGSLSSRATEEYEQLRDPASQATMQRVLLRMVASEGGELARRRVLRSELIYPDEAENARVTTVIQRLEEARLVVSDKTDEGAVYVEPAHDALVRAWDKLLTWHREAEDYLPLQRRLTQAAGEWAAEMDERTKTDLLWDEDPRLPQVEQVLAGSAVPEKHTWLARQWLRFQDLWRATLHIAEGHWLNQLELDFVRRSVDQRRKDGRRLVGTVVVVIAALLALTVFAFVQSNLAQQAAVQAENAEATAVKDREIAVTAQAEAQAAATQEAIARQDAEEKARVGRARELAAYVQTAEDSTGSLNLMLARESAFTTWLTDTAIITRSFVTNETLAALNFAVFNARQLPWRMTIPWRTRHTGAVNAVAYSPDGTRIVSGSDDQTVRVWNAQTGEELLQLVGHIDSVNAVAYSPDGMHIVSASDDQTVWVWDATTGAAIFQLTGHINAVSSVAYNPDGTRIVGGSGQTVWVWDAKTGVEIQQLTGHTGWVNAVAYSPDGTRIVSGSNDQTVRVWDAMMGVELYQLTGHIASVLAVAYSPDGMCVVSSSNDNTVRVWDAAKGVEMQKLEGHTGPVSTVVYSRDGKFIASGGNDNTVRVWDAVTGTELRRLTGHTASVLAVTYSPDGTHIASGGGYGGPSVRVWDAVTGIEEMQWLTGHTSRVWSVTYSPDGTRIVSGDEEGIVRVWDTATGVTAQQLTGHTSKVNAVAYSLDGMWIASGSDDQTVRVWETATGVDRNQLIGHTGSVNAVAYSPDGTRIVSGSADQTVKVWDTATSADLYQLIGHTGSVNAVAYSPDGTRIVSGSDDNTVRVWDATTGDELAQLIGHTSRVTAVAYSPDGMFIASGSWDETVRVWDTVTGVEVQRFTGHIGWVWSVDYSPDGMQIVSGGEDGTVRVWDAQSGTELLKGTGNNVSFRAVSYSPNGTCIVSAGSDRAVRVWDVSVTLTTGVQGSAALHTLIGHTGSVRAVAYNSDGTRIVSGGGYGDQTVRVWDVQRGIELLKMTGHSDWVNAVAYSPDGMRIVSGSADETVRVWDAQNGIQLLRMTGHEGRIYAVAYSPDGACIVSGSGDGTLRIWDAQSGAELHILHTVLVRSVAYSPDGTHIVSGGGGPIVWDVKSRTELLKITVHEIPISSVAYSPDGIRIVSAVGDQTVRSSGYLLNTPVRVWDAWSGVELQQLIGHRGFIMSVTYSPNGTRIVSGGDDLTVRVWDAVNEQELYRLTGHTGVINAVAYSPNGTQIVSASDDRTLRLWYVDIPHLLQLADSLIQRDPPIFVGKERSLYGFDGWPAAEH